MNDFSDVMNIAKVISCDSLERLAKKLVLHHKPITIDYVAKFGLQGMRQVSEVAADYQLSTPACPVCSKAMVQRVVNKGTDTGKAFWGCAQYPKCRGVISITN